MKEILKILYIILKFAPISSKGIMGKAKIGRSSFNRKIKYLLRGEFIKCEPDLKKRGRPHMYKGHNLLPPDTFPGFLKHINEKV